MGREPLEFLGKSLLCEFDGTLEPLTDLGSLLLVDLRAQGHVEVRLLDGRLGDLEIKHAVERRGVVAGVDEGAKSVLCLWLHRVVMAAKFPGGLLESLAVRLHGARKHAE